MLTIMVIYYYRLNKEILYKGGVIMAKSIFNMQIDDVQREVLDRIIDCDLSGMSVAGYLLFLVRHRAHEILGFDIEKDDFSFEVLLELLKKEEEEKQERIKQLMGEEKYNKMIAEFEKKKKKELVRL